MSLSPAREGHAERLVVKRRRTVKACDRCRAVRSRCLRPSSDSDSCVRCVRLLAECTTTQPLKSLSISQSSSASIYPLSSDLLRSGDDGTPISRSHGLPKSQTEQDMESTTDVEVSSERPSMTQKLAKLPENPPSRPSISLSAHLATEPRILGYTSLSSLRDEIEVNYGHDVGDVQDDERDEHVRQIGGNAGGSSGVHWGGNRGDRAMHGKINGPRDDGQLVERQLSLGVIETLLSDFATHISPLNPILLSSEVFNPSRMSVVTISAVCAVASLSRKVPTSIFLAARDRLVELLDISDVLTVASVANIQALLVATSKAELLMNQSKSSGGSLSFQRCSSAIRMAQELGLHRSEVKFSPDVQRRRRSAWRSCLIADRWLAAGYGLPQIIDLDDCDDVAGAEESEPQMILQAELYKASTLLGRVLKEIYTPKILARTNNDRVEALITDIDTCRSQSSNILRRTPTSNLSPIVFDLGILTVEALFLKGMTSHRIQIPSHVSFRPSPSRWRTISERAQILVDWIDESGDWLLDTTRIGLYGLTFCSLMMFRDHIDSGSPGALRSLRVAARATSRWAEGNGDTTMFYQARSKHAQILRTLYVVARDGRKGANNDRASVERVHIVSPLASDKRSHAIRKESESKASIARASFSEPTASANPPPVSFRIFEEETNTTDELPANSPSQEPLSSTFDANGLLALSTSEHASSLSQEGMDWMMPWMDNWLSEILEQEADGITWSQ